MQSRASSFNWQYPLLSLRSSSSLLRLLPRLLVTSVCPFIFPSITCCRRQFLCKMWPIQLAFHFLISCRIFLCSLTLSNTHTWKEKKKTFPVGYWSLLWDMGCYRTAQLVWSLMVQKSINGMHIWLSVIPSTAFINNANTSETDDTSISLQQPSTTTITYIFFFLILSESSYWKLWVRYCTWNVAAPKATR